jgi:hypothetical protein
LRHGRAKVQGLRSEAFPAMNTCEGCACAGTKRRNIAGWQCSQAHWLRVDR